MTKLDIEEKEILAAYDSGKASSVAGLKSEITRHRKIAGATFKKDARINIRIASRDLRALQKRALAEGIPYQTLIASILHKYAEGRTP
jgi:predicted DNA binding CopG/RHH family protein